MKAGTLLLIVQDLISLFQAQGYITTAGDLDSSKFDALANDLELISGVEQVLMKHGVTVSNKVDKLLALAPLVAGLFA